MNGSVSVQCIIVLLGGARHQSNFNSSLKLINTRGISLKEVRVDRILEGAVGDQEYKNSVKPGSHNLEGHL